MWNTLIQHLTLVICIVPLIGAGTVLFLSQWGRNVMRITAVVNVLLSCLLAIIAVSSFPFSANENTTVETDINVQQFQFESVIRWPGNISGVSSQQILSQLEENVRSNKHSDSQKLQNLPEINIRMGMDGIRLCFVCLISFIMIPVVLSEYSGSEKNSSKTDGLSSYCLILIAESLLFLMITSLNVILYLVAFQLLILVFYFLIGLKGGKEKDRVNRKYFLFQMAGMLMVSFGLILAAYAHSGIISAITSHQSTIDFSIVKIVQEIPVLASTNLSIMEYWDQFIPWIFWSLLIGFFITAGLFPFHTWYSTVNSETPASVAIFLSTVSLKIGLLGLLTIVFPLFPEMCASLSPFFIGMFLIASVYLALLTLAQDDLKKMGTYLCLSQLQLIAVGLFTFNDVARYGSIIMMLGHGIAFSLYFYLISVLENRFKTREMEAFSGLSQKYVRWSGLFCVTLFSLVGIPALVGFAGNFTLLIGISQANILYALPIGLVFVLQSWAIYWMLQRVVFGEFREPISIKKIPSIQKEHEFVSSELFANIGEEKLSESENYRMIQSDFYFLIPLLFALFLFGIVPGWILKAVDPAQMKVPAKTELKVSVQKTKILSWNEMSEQNNIGNSKEKLK